MTLLSISCDIQNFELKEQEKFLLKLNTTLDIDAKIVKSFDKRNNTEYHLIKIYKQEDNIKYFRFLSKDTESFELAKNLFPWKFDLNLRKKDVID